MIDQTLPEDAPELPEASEEAQDDAQEAQSADASSAQGSSEPTPSSLAPLDKEPFDWEKITITLVIQYLPTDGDPAGRQVMIGVRNSKDSPIVRLLRESEIGELPEPIRELLAELRASLPNRQLRSLKAQPKTAPHKPKPVPLTPPAPAMPGTETVPVVTPPARPVAAPAPKPKPEPSKAGQISMF